MTFTHLQIRSGYSFYHSTIQISQLIDQAKQDEHEALVLADEGILHGAVAFYQACQRHGIHPVLGMTLEVSIGEQAYQLTVLAKSNAGYRQLIQLSTKVQFSGDCKLEHLREHKEDMICILSMGSADIRSQLQRHQFEQLQAQLEPFTSVYSSDDFYLGVIGDEAEDMATVLADAKAYEQMSGTKMTAYTDVRYLKQNDYTAYTCLQAMKDGKRWQGTPIDSEKPCQHLRTKDEMATLYATWPALLTRSKEIALACRVSFDFEQTLLPEFPVPNGETAAVYLERRCKEVLPMKFVDNEVRASERLTHELEVIDSLGFSDYFLIVGDFVQFAKENGIVVGPGRGSAAGSLVAYLLGITNVDPLQYGLLFERFLNPERVTMPDIDIDFSDVRRDEVITYIREKYGANHVAQIITFGTYAARSLIRELMKLMEVDYRDQAYILKHIPLQASESLTYYIKQAPDFAAYIKQSNQLKRMFSVAIKLEGLPRHTSTHAAGVIIGQKDLLEDVPLMPGGQETFLTQYAMHELEAIGLLKMDVLGLRNLTLMERIVQSIWHSRKEEIIVDELPEDDAATFQLLQQGRTNGIFQLESAGMKNVLTSLKPESLEDIIALNALYRPGPMEQIPTYIKRKHDVEKVTYVHPKLASILQPTYGVLIYQEQIMQIAHEFAGLTLGQADVLRRAISKKNRQLIEEQQQTFLEGCRNQGYDDQVAKEVFSWILRFANYGFNKSHSVAYSKIGYQLSYLKSHYPTIFFAHLLGTAINDSKKLHMYVREANELGIQILPPSINNSNAYFIVENKDIRIGLMAIKGIGYETVREIVTARKERPFRDLFDFCLRTRNIKRNVLETLILAGTFDDTYDNRATLLASIDQALARAELFGDLNGQGQLFSNEISMKPAYTEVTDFTRIEKLADEKELLQMYVTDHPLQEYRRTLRLQNFQSIREIEKHSEKAKVMMAVIVQQVKKIHTKRGDSMAFLSLTDETGELDGVVFPALYREVSPFLVEEETVRLEGEVGIRQGKKQVIINQLEKCDLPALAASAPGELYIRLQADIEEEEALLVLQQAAEKSPGDAMVIIHDEARSGTYKLGRKYNIEPNKGLDNELKEYFGSKNVVFRM